MHAPPTYCSISHRNCNGEIDAIEWRRNIDGEVIADPDRIRLGSPRRCGAFRWQRGRSVGPWQRPWKPPNETFVIAQTGTHRFTSLRRTATRSPLIPSSKIGHLCKVDSGTKTLEPVDDAYHRYELTDSGCRRSSASSGGCAKAGVGTVPQVCLRGVNRGRLRQDPPRHNSCRPDRNLNLS